MMETTEGLGAGVRIGDYIIEACAGDSSEAVHVLLPRRARLTVAVDAADAKPVLREACILEALHHPGVPRLFEVGVLPETHTPWFACELITGTSLADIALESRRVRIQDVLEVLRDVSEILAYAHARGVAHGGVRPDAIICDDGSRGFSLCLTNWRSATAPSVEDSDRMFGEDVFALGLVADLMLGERTNAPAKLLALVDDMLGPDPFARPWAVEVSARAKLIAEELDTITDEDVVDVVAARPTIPPPLPARARIRWTPAIGLHPAPAQGAALGVLTRGTAD